MPSPLHPLLRRTFPAEHKTDWGWVGTAFLGLAITGGVLAYFYFPGFFVGPQGESGMSNDSQTPTDPVVATLPTGDNSRLLAAIVSRAVETNPLYKRNRLGLNETWCNRFAADVSADIGYPIKFEPTHANDQIVWLRGGGGGFAKCTKDEAQAASAAGGLGVACLFEEPSGHIMVARGDGDWAQAGASNFSKGSLARGMGLLNLGKVEFFAVGGSSHA